MKLHTFRRQVVAALAGLLLLAPAFAADPAPKAATGKTMSFAFGPSEFLHRWSRDGQNEFTPPNDPDLTKWRDMVTINTHETIRSGEQLADLANRVLGRYQQYGKILRTDSKPQTPQRPAEHLIVAVLGNPGVLEAAFARILLSGGNGYVVVYSHRIYAADAGPAMSEWLKANGATVESTLMSWDKLPPLASLKQLPQAK